MGGPPYFPFDSRRHLHIGLAAMEVREWLEIDQHFAAYLTIKRRLLAERYAEVYASLPGSESAQGEVLALLVQHLPHYFPGHYRLCDEKLENLLTGEVWDLQHFEGEPLTLAARLVQEDLCLLRPDPEGYKLIAACVCFPSRWLLREKMGRPLALIHKPVPGYDAQLERPVERFFERMSADRPLARLNWTIVDSPELFLLPGTYPPAVPVDGSNAGERLWIRVERQNLRRLGGGEVLFTIRTYLYPLNILSTQPALARTLVDAIVRLPPAMQLYKSLLPIREALLAYLAAVV